MGKDITYEATIDSKVYRLYAIVFVAAIALYVISCAPGSLWQDSGMIQYRVWDGDIEGGLGLALSHPLFYIIAIVTKYVPFGGFTHKVNLVSAIAGAVTVANLFLLLLLWLGRNLPAIVGAITLAVSHTFWRHASIAETYSLYTALFTAELIMLLRYTQTRRVGYLYFLALLNGLAIADHMFALIPLVCYAVLVFLLLAKKGIHFKDLGIIILFWMLGALPYEYLVIKNIIQSGDITGTLASAIFGRSWQGEVLNTSISGKIVKENLLFLGLNFPTPNILLFFVGILSIFKVSAEGVFRNILLGTLVLFFAFAFRYTVPDRYAFFIPFYCLVSVFVGLGAHQLQERMSSKALNYLVLILALIPILVYVIAPGLAEKRQLNLGVKRQVPYRNEYIYFLRPWKTGYYGADRFAAEALDTVEDDAIIYADGTTVYPILLAQQTEGKRKDVSVISGHGSVDNLAGYGENEIDDLFTERPIYVVSPIAGYCPKFLLSRCHFSKIGVLYKAILDTDAK